MINDTTWTLLIETASGTDTVVVSGLDAETPTLTAGTTMETQLAFFDDGGGTPFYERYERLVPFTDINHDAATRRGTSDDGVPWFRERYPDDAPVESVLVGVEPGEDVIDARGWWGLLVGLDDQSAPKDETGGRRLLQAEWFVLAPFEAFDDHDAVRQAFADEVLG